MSTRPRIYLDHAATTPILPAAKAALVEAMDRWANPSSPHGEGRAARAALEDARERIKKALGWKGELIFTSGATEAIEIALGAFDTRDVAISPVEHDAITRGRAGRAPDPAPGGLLDPVSLPPARLIAVQHANNETGLLQPVDEIAVRAREAAALSSATAPKPRQAPTARRRPDLRRFPQARRPPGVGALLVRDLSVLKARGGQERGYRPGTQNLPAILGFAAALIQPNRGWTAPGSCALAWEARLQSAGAEVGGQGRAALPTIGAYRKPGVSSEAQLIHFDLPASPSPPAAPARPAP
jgi:cysteine desulfurase